MTTSSLFRHGHAVVIGVGDDLAETVTDAHSLADVLRDPARCAYSPDHVELLTEASANRTNILDALDRLATRCAADPEATAIVFYSGHGGYRLGNKTYFLVPYGFSWGAFKKTVITGDEFFGKVGALQAPRVLVLLDCCHAGGLAQAKGFKKAPLPPRLTDLFKKGSGRAVIASSRADELSWTGTPCSVFTAALLEGLAGYGSLAQTGVVELMDVVRWVGHQVPQRTGDKQHPILDFAQVTAAFPLAYYAGGQKQPKRFDWSRSAPPEENRPEGDVALPGPLEFVQALSNLLPAEFRTVLTGLQIQVAKLPGDSQQEKANWVHFLAVRDRKLPELHRLILDQNPSAFEV